MLINMAIKIKEKKIKADEIMRQKAALFDELIEYIEDKGMGLLMHRAESEITLSLDKAKKKGMRKYAGGRQL